MRRSLFSLLLMGAVILVAGATPASAQNCGATVTWFTNPSIPTEVSGGLNADNCAFHQFAWQAFAALIQPSQGELVFETWMPDYGVFVANGQQPTPWGQSPPTPCTSDDPKANGRFFRPRVVKTDAGAVNPNSTQQAFGGALYDQNNNVVYYEAWMNQTEYDFITGCQFYNTGCMAAAPVGTSLPSGTIEVKTSWRVLSGPSPDYYTVQGVVGSSCTPVTLGLVGFHLVANTPIHQEFIWATFEHKSNAPDCPGTGVTPPAGGWSFFNPNCTSGGKPCAVNQQNTIPTQVCRVTPYGGGDSQNVANIQSINQSVYSTMEKLAATDPQKYGFYNVWSNYFMTGNLWTNNGELPPSSSNFKGSTLNANTTMETFAQNTSGFTNCFSCHSEEPQPSHPGFQSPSPANFSHFFAGAVATGGCGNGQGPLPAMCPVNSATALKRSTAPAGTPAAPPMIPAHGQKRR
ncbi:MAG TPA: hypothetical protein VIW92_15180 [Thermoanaerobaculia bacterium]